MTESLERHQEKLEEKQAACLEQIRELEKQVTGTATLAPKRVGPAPGVKGPCSRERPVRRSGGGNSPLTSGFHWGPRALLHEAALQVSLLVWHPLS